MLRNSLRFRIVSAFCLFCIITGITYTSFVIMTMVSSEDELFNHRITLEINKFLDQYAQNPDAPLPNSAYIKGYFGKTELSERQLSMIKDQPDSVFENEDMDLHVGIVTLPDRDEKLYVFHDTSELEIHDYKMKQVIILMVISILFFLVLALIFSFSVFNKVIEPVIRLADIIRASNPEKRQTGFSKDFYNDETGFLARTLEQYLIEMDRAIQEEKRFASDVSHELRTPVTTVKGALAVIKRKSRTPGETIEKPLARIERAVKDMENLIETFLTLSRVKGYLPNREAVNLSEIIRDLVDQNRYLLNHKTVEVRISDPYDLTVTVSALFFKIVISNLIRNAFQYTRSGTITIFIKPDRIRISDTGIGFSLPELPTGDENLLQNPENHGFGIGLSIVHRLCDKAGWQLFVTSRRDIGTIVELVYH